MPALPQPLLSPDVSGADPPSRAILREKDAAGREAGLPVSFAVLSRPKPCGFPNLGKVDDDVHICKASRGSNDDLTTHSCRPENHAPRPSGPRRPTGAAAAAGVLGEHHGVQPGVRTLPAAGSLARAEQAGPGYRAIEGVHSLAPRNRSADAV